MAANPILIPHIPGPWQTIASDPNWTPMGIQIAPLKWIEKTENSK